MWYILSRQARGDVEKIFRVFRRSFVLNVSRLPLSCGIYPPFALLSFGSGETKAGAKLTDTPTSVAGVCMCDHRFIRLLSADAWSCLVACSSGLASKPAG